MSARKHGNNSKTPSRCIQTSFAFGFQVAENLATCAADVERNAELALQMRKKTDEVLFGVY